MAIGKVTLRIVARLALGRIGFSFVNTGVSP